MQSVICDIKYNDRIKADAKRIPLLSDIWVPAENRAARRLCEGYTVDEISLFEIQMNYS
jgi:hypothetical protein